MKGFDAHVHRSRHGPNGFLGFLTDLHTVQVNRTSVLVAFWLRSEEHTSELQSQSNLVCRLLLEKKKNKTIRASCEIANPLPVMYESPLIPSAVVFRLGLRLARPSRAGVRILGAGAHALITTAS